jgi:hypothetical protein
MAITDLKLELSRTEREGIRKHRREVRQQTDEELSAQTDEEFLIQHINEQIALMRKGYLLAELPNIATYGERFLDADDETRALIESKLPPSSTTQTASPTNSVSAEAVDGS